MQIVRRFIKNQLSGSSYKVGNTAKTLSAYAANFKQQIYLVSSRNANNSSRN